MIQGGISEKLNLALQGIAALIAAFIVAFIVAFVVQWKLTLICLCIAPATLIVNGIAGGFMGVYENQILEPNAKANAFVESVLSSVRTVHAFEISGKSKIVGLLERWYNPSSGSIKLDGHPLDELNLSWLRKNVRLVQQEPVLFQGTVFDNIKQGLVGTRWEHALRAQKMERIQGAATMAFAHEFIADPPNGYDTEIGQRGGLLLGGQKQRIAIARSVVSQHKVLILDEATSALDPHSESIVQGALNKAAEGRTTIVIAHKLAIIRKADSIIDMGKCCIIKQGTHSSLLARGRKYSRLARAQDLTMSSQPEPVLESESINEKVEAVTKHSVSASYNSVDKDHRHTPQNDYAEYDDYKQRNIIFAIYRLLQENHELRYVYCLAFTGCIVGGKSM